MHHSYFLLALNPTKEPYLRKWVSFLVFSLHKEFCQSPLATPKRSCSPNQNSVTSLQKDLQSTGLHVNFEVLNNSSKATVFASQWSLTVCFSKDLSII
ncbi:hypothetical protein E2C01_071664 [Portunus trituberculatus]|uniref:Uncharacterized protein n=1 Tax=Portunus trituberculatus TaxID=210409 RepID=A0A5B7I5I9_PORTR|nr:hypothetical protein [Portunus trituberculatus]